MKSQSETTTMRESLLHHNHLSQVIRERKHNNDEYAQKIFDENLSAVGSPESLYFASELAFIEGRLSDTFDSNFTTDKTQQVANIKKLSQETQEIYLEMLAFQHYGNDTDNYLIQDDTKEHLNILKHYGFAHDGHSGLSESMIQLAKMKLAESNFNK